MRLHIALADELARRAVFALAPQPLAMPHTIHIDELILHDFDLSESHGITFERALQAELTRLLGAGDLPTESFAAPRLNITLPGGPASPMALGVQAATSVAALVSRGDAAP